MHLGRCYARATLEGLPGVLENKEILTKGNMSLLLGNRGTEL